MTDATETARLESLLDHQDARRNEFNEYWLTRREQLKADGWSELRLTVEAVNQWNVFRLNHPIPTFHIQP